MIRMFLPALLIIATLNGCASKPEIPPIEVGLETTRSLENGDVAGFVDYATGVDVWRGIPFAAPPVGDLRWRAPRAPESWEGVRSSIDFAPWCPQIRSGLDDGSSAEDVPRGGLMGQEDCLYLDVYAPHGAQGKDLPVMMWIHGGSNTWGRAEQYNPARLVADENVIVVVVQYRLGPLGWFAHPALRASAETDLDKAANFGTLDQIAALKWIRQNASAFGGNSDNVTIFGESAGGHNVIALLASPMATGLFHRAIIQSGSFDSYPLDVAETGDPLSATTIANSILGETGDATALRDISIQNLFDAYDMADGETDAELPRIIQDGVVLPSTPLRAAFSSRDTFNTVPLITGTNRDETKLWNIFDDRLVKRRLGVIPIARDKQFYDTVSKYPSRMWRATSVDEPATDIVKGGHADVWTYRFDWDEGRTYWGADFAHLFGAAHSLEIPFMMGDFDFLKSAGKYIFTKDNAPEREQLSTEMMRMWADFARDGNPGEKWRPWQQTASEIMLFDSASSGGARMVADRESTERIVSDLKSDTTVDEEQRCLVFFAMLWWAEDPDSILPESCVFPEG